MEPSRTLNGLRRLRVVLDVLGVQLGQQLDRLGVDFENIPVVRTIGTLLFVLFRYDGLLLLVDDNIRIQRFNNWLV